MARVRWVVTDSWQLVNNSYRSVITVDVMNRCAKIQFNETPSDVQALEMIALPNTQIIQNEDKPVYVRASAPGYEIVVDYSVPSP